MFDASLGATGGVAAVQVVEPAADRPIIQAAAGTDDPGKMFTAGGGTGAVLNLTAMADGTIRGTVTAAGTGYAIGDTATFAAGSLAWGAAMTGDTQVVVTRLAGAAATGGWRFATLRDWLKQTAAAADHAYGMEPGDFQSTIQAGSEELKVWTGTTWKVLYSAKEVEVKISALSLFEGTVKQVGGAAVPGAVDFTGLPDLTAPDPGAIAAAVAKASHYWTFTGTPGYSIKATDPNGLGRDLANAVLQVGDWIQVSNRGTAAAPDLHYVHIGGDLLTKARSASLYGLADWVSGSYETGSLVNHQGGLWRATQAVLPTDAAPGTAGAPWVQVPLTAGVRNVATDADRPATAPASDVYLVLNSALAGGKPALWSYDPGAAKWIQLGGSSGNAMKLTGGTPLVGVGCPVGTIVMWGTATIPDGWLLCNGQVPNATLYPELKALYPTGIPDLRGAFVRGAGLNGNGRWGDAGRQVVTGQEDSTKRPGTALTGTTSSDGTHHHAGSFKIDTNEWQRGNPGGGYVGYRDGNVDDAGAHTHTVTINGGGDAETRPVNVALNYIIKGADQTVALKV